MVYWGGGERQRGKGASSLHPPLPPPPLPLPYPFCGADRGTARGTQVQEGEAALVERWQGWVVGCLERERERERERESERGGWMARRCTQQRLQTGSDGRPLWRCRTDRW